MQKHNSNKKEITLDNLKDGFLSAIPVILGYVAIGLPCGILSSAIGMTWWQCLALSFLFYSGAGQFMIPNMFLAGSSILSVFASVSFVNTRQMLYSAALIPYVNTARKRLIFWYTATVTDETFGIAISKFKDGNWSIGKSIFLNEFSHLSWTIATVAGCLIGPIFNIPLPIASFAMTSIFICLLMSAMNTKSNVVAAFFAVLATIIAKSFNLGGFCIFVGAIVGVACGYIFDTSTQNKDKGGEQ